MWRSTSQPRVSRGFLAAVVATRYDPKDQPPVELGILEKLLAGIDAPGAARKS